MLRMTIKMTRIMMNMTTLDWGQMVSSQWAGSSQYSQELTHARPHSVTKAGSEAEGRERLREAVLRNVLML